MGDTSPPKAAASSSIGPGAELLDLVGEPPPPTDFSKQIEAGSGRGWEYILVGGGWKLAFMTFHMLEMSSSQLTNIFQRATRYSLQGRAPLFIP